MDTDIIQIQISCQESLFWTAAKPGHSVIVKWNQRIIITGVHNISLPEGGHAVDTGNLVCHLPRLVQSGQKHTGENGDDRHDDEELYEGENPYFHPRRKGKERSGKPRSPILPETDFSCIALLPFLLPSQDKSCKSPDHVIILFLNPL